MGLQLKKPIVFKMKRISEMSSSVLPAASPDARANTSLLEADPMAPTTPVIKSQLFKDSKKRSISVLVAPSESRYSNFGPLFDKLNDESVYQYALTLG